MSEKTKLQLEIENFTQKKIKENNLLYLLITDKKKFEQGVIDILVNGKGSIYYTHKMI